MKRFDFVCSILNFWNSLGFIGLAVKSDEHFAAGLFAIISLVFFIVGCLYVYEIINNARKINKGRKK